MMATADAASCMEPDSDLIDSPLFNNHSAESAENDMFTQIDDSDDDMLPPLNEEELEHEEKARSRHTVVSVVNVDEMKENDFPDSGKSLDKTPEDAMFIIDQIKSVVLFEGYDEDELLLVAGYMYLQSVKKGEVVIQIGDVGDALFVIQSGSYTCTIPGRLGNADFVKVYNGTGYFGELALVNQAPRAATITASSDGSLWVLNALRYAWLKKKRAMLNAERFEQVIRAIPMFRDNLNPGLTNRLIDAIEVVNLASGDVICREGDSGDAMYFIMDGEVEALIENRRVKLMKRNDFFGERALILYEGRAATCCTTTKTKLAKLPKESFNLLIPDAVVEKMRHHMIASYGRKVAALVSNDLRRRGSQSSSSYDDDGGS